MAPGTLECLDECSEVILFTKDTEILTKIADYDAAAGSEAQFNIFTVARLLKLFDCFIL